MRVKGRTQTPNTMTWPSLEPGFLNLHFSLLAAWPIHLLVKYLTEVYSWFSLTTIFTHVDFYPYTLTLACTLTLLFSIHFLLTDKENLFNNQNFQLIIICSLLMTLVFDTGVMLLADIRC